MERCGGRKRLPTLGRVPVLAGSDDGPNLVCESLGCLPADSMVDGDAILVPDAMAATGFRRTGFEVDAALLGSCAAEAANAGELSSHAVVGRLQVALGGMTDEYSGLRGSAMAGSGKYALAGTDGIVAFLDAVQASNEGEPADAAMAELQKSAALEHVTGNDGTSGMSRMVENPEPVTSDGSFFCCVASIVSHGHPSAAMLTAWFSLDPAAASSAASAWEGETEGSGTAPCST